MRFLTVAFPLSFAPLADCRAQPLDPCYNQTALKITLAVATDQVLSAKRTDSVQ
jgi:hypothetical protein